MNVENLGNFRGILRNVGENFNKHSSFSSITYFSKTTRSCASNEQSLVNFRDGHSVLVTCCIAGVDVE